MKKNRRVLSTDEWVKLVASKIGEALEREEEQFIDSKKPLVVDFIQTLLENHYLQCPKHSDEKMLYWKCGAPVTRSGINEQTFIVT